MKKPIVLSLILLLSAFASAAAPTTPNVSNCDLYALSHLPALPQDTSPDVKLQRQGYRSEVESWLRLAEERKATQDVTPEICYALVFVKLGSFTLDSFGTSMPKLAELQRQGYHFQALVWIRLAREGAKDGDVTSEIDHAKEYAKLAGEKFEELMKLPTSALPPAPSQESPKPCRQLSRLGTSAVS